MTIEEFISTFRNANEKTMSSPSGVHYFHYKASTCDRNITQLLSTRMSLPCRYPFQVIRWSKSHHVLLPKTNPPLLNKLRNIQILEADYNSYFKCKINHQLLKHKSTAKILQNQMYGGIQQRSSHLAIINQLLINDYIISTKSSAYITKYDAANCFDRMIPNLTSIALTRLGSPHEIGIQLAINSLHTTHRITSKHGLSTYKITRPPSTMWSGIGQGNSVAGPSWLALETSKISTYDDTNTQLIARDPTDINKYSSSIIAYIDDNNTSKIFPSHTTTEAIIQNNNENSIRWENILKSSGGKLSHDKCSTQIIQWAWNKNQLTIIPIDDCKRHELQKISIIPITNPYQSNKYLGCLINLNNNNNEQFHIATEFTQQFVNTITTSHLPTKYVFTAYSTIYLPKLH